MTALHRTFAACCVMWLGLTFSAQAAPLVASLTANNASGTVQFLAGEIVPFAGASVTFSASTDTTAFSPGCLGTWVSLATPVVISVPGVISATAAVPTSSLAGGNLCDPADGYIEFELGSKVNGVSVLQGAFAFDPALIDYDFHRGLGPVALPSVTVGQLSPAGPMVVNTLDGAHITMSALSAGELVISLPACVYSLLPLDLSNIAVAGGSLSITVTTPDGCPVSVDAFSQSWVTVNGITPNAGMTTVSLQIAANAGAARATSIRIADRLFLVSQSGTP